jgi:integrase
VSNVQHRPHAQTKTSALEQKTKTYYQTGWRLLKMTEIPGMRLVQITADMIEATRFPGSPSNANCALRTLRRMLHKAEEWKLLQKVPKFKLVKEYGRSRRLDDESERKLIAVAATCGWRKASFELFRDIVLAIRETGMRNQRELYRMRVENIDWTNKVIFVPDSKTPNGRRPVPISDRVEKVLRQRCGNRREGWVFPAKRFSVRPSNHDRQTFSGSAAQSRSSRELGALLWSARLRNSRFERDGQSCRRDENDGPQGCENRDAVSTP